MISIPYTNSVSFKPIIDNPQVKKIPLIDHDIHNQMEKSKNYKEATKSKKKKKTVM